MNSRRAKPKSHSYAESQKELPPLSLQEKGAVDYFATAVLPSGSFVVTPGIRILDAAAFVKWNLATVQKKPGSWLAKLAIEHLRDLKTYIESNNK